MLFRNDLEVFHENEGINFLGKTNNQIIIQVGKSLLKYFQNGSFGHFLHSNYLNSEITGILKKDNETSHLTLPPTGRKFAVNGSDSHNGPEWRLGQSYNME